jgi:hypothetical protein
VLAQFQQENWPVKKIVGMVTALTFAELVEQCGIIGGVDQRIQFSVRDLFWATVAVALSCFAWRLFPDHGLRVVILVLLIALISVWFHPDEQEARRYGILLSSRKETDDDELFTQYFTSVEIAPDLPGRVRQIFAKEMGYPAAKMLPDDDLSFYWNEMDLACVVRELETSFGIEFSNADLSLPCTPCTIRTFCNVVLRKRLQ